MRQLVHTILLLIITLRFTCREREICSPIKKSQNIMNLIVGTKFQLKLTILNLWTKFAEKGYFRSKTKKLYFHVCSWSLHSTLNFFALGLTNITLFLMSLLLLAAETKTIIMFIILCDFLMA